jgi:hypothetical protein
MNICSQSAVVGRLLLSGEVDVDVGESAAADINEVEIEDVEAEVDGPELSPSPSVSSIE